MKVVQDIQSKEVLVWMLTKLVPHLQGTERLSVVRQTLQAVNSIMMWRSVIVSALLTPYLPEDERFYTVRQGLQIAHRINSMWERGLALGALAATLKNCSLEKQYSLFNEALHVSASRNRKDLFVDTFRRLVQ